MEIVKSDYDEVLNKLQLVVIDYACFAWDNPLVKNVLHETLNVKFKGYPIVYGPTAIAADKSDFVGTHLIACFKEGNELKPMMGYKSITLDRCDEFLMEFPGLSLLRSDADPECYKELENIVAKARASRRRISFDSSWAQEPSFKTGKSPEVKQLFQDLVMLMVVLHHKEFEIDEMVTCGVLKVKTDLFFDKLGMSGISNHPSFPQKTLGNEMVRAFHTHSFSAYSAEVVEKYKWLWDNKIYLNGSLEINKDKKAA